MNIIQIYAKYPTQEACLEHLEKTRWKDGPKCTYCQSVKVYKHTERSKIRWQCGDCRKSFSVTVGTIFHNTHVDLQKWFLLIALMLNAKKGLSAYQAARDIELRRPTVWSMMHRIRNAMKDNGELLSGIIEMDETYIGGKPRKGNKRDDDDFSDKSNRGKGTKKIPVVGMVERKGSVKAQSVSKYQLKAHDFHALIRKEVDTTASVLITDEYRGYVRINSILPHTRINHSERYVRGMIHTNTIESFWAIVKRGIIGQYHKVSAKYLDKYLDEFCYRYNGRISEGTLFETTLLNMLCG
jgi:transposase-like protein